MNNIVGIKLADGSFYPILEEGTASSKILDLTTVRDNQETVQLDLYKAIDGDETNLEYVDTLLIENLLPRAKEEPTLSLGLSLDEDDVLSASIEDAESGESSSLTVSLLNSSEPTQVGSPDFSLANTSHADLFSSTFMDDVPREVDTSNKNVEDTFKIHEPFDSDEPTEKEDDSIETGDDFTIDDSSLDVDENFENEDFTFDSDDSFEIDEPEIEEPEIDINVESTETFGDNISAEVAENAEQENLEEDSFPTFPEDLDVSAFETHAQEKDDSMSEEHFTDSMYDFGDSIDDNLGDLDMKEEEFSTEGLDDSMATPEFSFSDLYDTKETAKEKKEVFEQEKPKSNLLLIVLIILLLFACIGLLVFLFWGKNDSKQKSEDFVVQAEVLEENRFAAEPSIGALVEEEKTDAAKEDEIVKLEAEVVVPEPVRETPVEAEVIAYKIKWGDTLWDISNAYYKTPWLYPKIADYNGIKNPDYIISGTWINIPPK